MKVRTITMKQKKFKFSLGLKIATILSCVALVSMGFASWWIVKPPVNQTAEGSFEVYTVDTKNINISEPTFTNSNIIFGKTTFPANATNHKWLIAGDDVKDENLKATMNFTVSVTDGDAATGTSNVADFLQNVKLTMTVPEALQTAITNKYIDAANSKITYKTTGGTEKTDSAVINGTADSVELLIDMSGATKVNDEDAAVYSVGVEVTFEFAWGEKFHSENPYTYFNKQAYTGDLATEAKGVLAELAKLSTTTKFEVTLEGTLKG